MVGQTGKWLDTIHTLKLLQTGFPDDMMWDKEEREESKMNPNLGARAAERCR